MAVANDVGRIVAAPYQNDSVQLGVLYGADGLYNALFIVVYLWRTLGGHTKAKLVKPFTDFPAARRWIDENHEAALRDYMRV